jgi:hypothetical protein
MLTYAGSIPDGIIGIFFIDFNLPAALWSTQPVIEMSRGKGKGNVHPITVHQGLIGSVEV